VHWVALELLSWELGQRLVIVPTISFISHYDRCLKAWRRLSLSILGRILTIWIRTGYAKDHLQERTKAVMAVHFSGTVCGVDELEQICRDMSSHLIRDTAHAHGSEWHRGAGSFGVLGSFSFRTEGRCSGEGGMLVTSNDSLAEAARSITNCGLLRRAFLQARPTGAEGTRSKGHSKRQFCCWHSSSAPSRSDCPPYHQECRLVERQLCRMLVRSFGGWPEGFVGAEFLVSNGPAGCAADTNRDGFVRSLVEPSSHACTPFIRTLYQNPLAQRAFAR